MMNRLQTYAARLAVRMHGVGADVDPEILQLPGGSVIATLLWLYATGAQCLRKH